MSSTNYNPEHHKLKTDLTTARGELSATLDRYAELCLKIRNTHHQGSFKDTHIAGFPWSEVAPELQLLPSLEKRLQEATYNLTRAHYLGRARGSSDYLPPIDKLPDEILAQVFRIAVMSQNYDLTLADKRGVRAFPRLPDSIAQTCARWRDVAVACSPLWTHVYLAPHPTHFSSVLDHAKLYAQRAGHLPLEIHIADIEGQPDPNPSSNVGDWQQFLASIAHRTKSLEINRGNSSISEIESEAFTSILRGCSNLFTRLVVHSKGLPSPGFIEPLNQNEDEEDWGPGVIEIGLSREQIEHGLEHLTILHASQIYPRWTSSAYHGLVDLRLMSDHKYIFECPRIEPSEFNAILKASPHLRILHFGLNLEYSNLDPPMNLTSARLSDLEVLYLSASSCYGPEDTEYEIQRIMGHIAPGSKPLRLTLDLAGYHDPEPLETMKTFFSKSHIVKFCTKSGTPPPVHLLDCAPHITNLIFDHCRYGILYDFDEGRSGALKLDTWVIRDSSIYIEDLKRLIKQYPAQSLTVSNCRLFSKDDGPVEIPQSELWDWGFEPPDCVQIVSQDLSPDPTMDWDNLD
ncbi:hypothetical protein FRC11_004882 [Ceratobasidium sp. 423]|nr:hypothetical protein FRC11_004882 [Ceratobasidium sp. 423]